MPLNVGDVGTVIELSVENKDIDNTLQTPPEFTPGTDTVNFVFHFSDGTKFTGTGEFIASTTARYVTQSGDTYVEGRTELRLKITSATWTGSTTPLILSIGKEAA